MFLSFHEFRAPDNDLSLVETGSRMTLEQRPPTQEEECESEQVFEQFAIALVSMIRGAVVNQGWSAVHYRVVQGEYVE
jgi:hypothetical protein